VTTDTATTLPKALAVHTRALHHRRPTSQEASRANTADSQAITATLHLHPDSTAAVLRHSNMATANPSKEARSHNTKDTAHKLVSVDRVDQATVELLLLVATDSRQVMAAQHKATTVVQETTTTTSTTRYVLSWHLLHRL
jgi:predicted peptidase